MLRYALFFLIICIMAWPSHIHGVEPLDRASIVETNVVNALGHAVGTKINTNQQVHIMSTIKNNQDQSQNFVHIVQIKDSENSVVKIKWNGGELLPGQQLSSALSWTPADGGQYHVEIFVWDDFRNRVPLSWPSSLAITVS